MCEIFQTVKNDGMFHNSIVANILTKVAFLIHIFYTCHYIPMLSDSGATAVPSDTLKLYIH